jgi:MFS family permease
MTTPLDVDATPRSSIRRVALASFIGSAIELYDLNLYSTAAALVFPRLFFPEFNRLAGTLASFATFSVAFVARPVGGAVFGHFGDRIGRKSMLVITLLIMGGATFFVGLLPTFQQVGVLAPFLLATLRFLQGFAVGGEWGGAMLMTVEHAPETRRNFYASWPQLGSPAGLILATAVFAAFSLLPDEQFYAWGWRAPFLLSIVLIAVGLFIRLRVFESPAFSRVKARGALSRRPLLDVLRDYPVGALLAVGVVLGYMGGFYIITTFTLSYLTGQFGMARSVVLSGTVLAGVADCLGIVILARAADRVGTRRVAIWSAACVFLFAFPYFWLIDTGKPVFIWIAMSAWMFGAGALYGVTGVIIAELFPARVRYSGISIGYQMAALLGGAFAPLIATALIEWAGGASWPVATYLAAMSLISLVAVCLASENRRVAIHDLEPARHPLVAEPSS